MQCITQCRIAASNAASYVTRRIFSTDILYSCAYFLVEIAEKCSHNDWFKYELMMISDSGLLFGPPCILPIRRYGCL